MTTNNIRCYVCGCLVFTTARRSMCPDCRREREAEKNRLKRANYRHVLDLDAYQVVSDPDPIGGFPRGAIINGEELEQMLRPAYCSFTPGTLLKSGRGKLFEIVPIDHGGLKLLPI